MNTLKLFNTYELSEDETLRGLVLTEQQKRVLINRAAQLSQEILSYPATSTSENYFEKLNFQRGQLTEIQNMLNASDEAEIELNNVKED